MRNMASLAIVLLCTAMSVSANTKVKETTSFYRCCGTPTLKFNPKCECTWEIKNRMIAHYNVKPQGCSSPCKALLDGLLTLDQCVDVKADCDCENGDFIEGEIIHYREEPCRNTAPTNLPSVVLLLWCLIAGWQLLNHRFWLFFMVL